MERARGKSRGVGGSSTRASPPATTLSGRWLLLARMAWAAVAITALAIVLFSVPSSFEHYRSVCTDASEVCSQGAIAQPTPEGVGALRDVGLSVRSYALLNVVIDKVFELVWFAVGALIFLRRSDDRMALLVSVFLVAFGTVTVDTTAADALVSSQPAWSLPVEGVQIIGEVCVVLFFLLFPGGRFVPRWTRWLAVVFIAFQISRDMFPHLYSGSSAVQIVSLSAFSGMVVSLVWAQIYRYRRVSSEAQRRQTRWVVFGTALGVAGTFPFKFPVDLLTRWGYAFRSTRPQNRLRVVVPTRPIVHRRSRVALAPVRHRRDHKPHPRIRLSDSYPRSTLLQRGRGTAK